MSATTQDHLNTFKAHGRAMMAQFVKGKSAKHGLAMMAGATKTAIEHVRAQKAAEAERLARVANRINRAVNAVRLQAWWRGFSSRWRVLRMKVKRGEELRLSAVSTIQKAVRSKLRQRRLESASSRESSPTKKKSKHAAVKGAASQAAAAGELEDLPPGPCWSRYFDVRHDE